MEPQTAVQRNNAPTTEGILTMKLVRTVAAVTAATALAFGAAAPGFTADAAPVTAAQVAGNTPVGTVKNWNACLLYTSPSPRD